MIRTLRTILALFVLLVLIAGPVREHESAASLPKTPGSVCPEVVIAAVGDIMMPLSVQNAVAKNGNDFDLLFERISPDLGADIVFGNLETPVDDRRPPSGYPQFNTGPGLLRSLRKAGFTIVSAANNHALDDGVKGIVRTMQNLDAAGLGFIGVGRDREEADRGSRIDVRGLSIEMLAYTYDTNNGMPKKKKEMPAVNVLRNGAEADLAAAAARVKQARQRADLVVVSLHWGEEYSRRPTAWQRRVAQTLVLAGADVILGHHPHVLQPVETLTGPDGRRGIVAYSLGNFLTSQNYSIVNGNRDIGRALQGDGVIFMIYCRKENGRTVITHTGFLPTWVLREWNGKSILARPVSIRRELARLETKKKRSAGDNALLSLLRYRSQVIEQSLSGRSGPALR